MIQHAWMNLEKMLSERYHQERPRIISFRLYEMSKIGKSIETENEMYGWEVELGESKS